MALQTRYPLWPIIKHTVNKILSVSLLHVVSLEFLYLSDLNKNNKKHNHNSFTAI
jgi:hypothetical protein